MEAGEAAGLVMRAASIGGHSVMQRLRDAQEEALRAAEAAAEDAWATQQAAQYRAAAQAAAQAANAGKPAEVPDVSSGPQVLTSREGGSSGQAADSSDSATGARPLAGSRAAASSSTGGASLGATAVVRSGPAFAAAPPPEVALASAPEAALLVVTEALAREPLSKDSTAACGGSGAGNTAVGPGPRQSAAPSAARGAPARAECVSDPGVIPRSAVPVPATATASLDGPLTSPRFSSAPSSEPQSPEVSDAESSEGGSSSASLDLVTLMIGLAETAQSINPEGKFDWDSLLVASRAADLLLEHVVDLNLAPADFLAAFFSPMVRTGIMQLVSLAVRRIADGPAQPGNGPTASSHGLAQRKRSWKHWQRILLACLHLLTMSATHCRCLESVSAELRALVGPGVAVVTSVMLRTDLLPALSRVLAAATAAAEAYAGCNSEGSGGDSGASGGGNGPGGNQSAGSAGSEKLRRSKELQRWSSAVHNTCNMVAAWHKLCLGSPSAVSLEVFAPTLRLRLANTICDSHVLEHAARAVQALLGPSACREALGCNSQDLSSRLADLLQCACMAIPASEQEVVGILADNSADFQSADDQRALPLLAFRSPCLQHLLLLHTVAQLCAVDGDTDYGLPPGAALPAVTYSDVCGPDKEFITVIEDAVCSALKCWAAGAAGPQPAAALLPCERRHLWSLCMRVIDAAVMPLESFGYFSSWFNRAVSVELRALMLAVALAQGEPAVGSMDGLWAPAVRAVRRVFVGSCWEEDLPNAKKLLLALRLPGRPLGCPLPAEPPADVSAALASGFVACLEMTLRYHAMELAQEPQESERMATIHLSGASRLVHSLRGNMALLAYEEPRMAASVIATGSKILRRALAQAAKALAADPGEAGDSSAVAQYRRKRFLAACADLARSLSPGISEDDVRTPWSVAVEVSRENQYWWRRTGGGNSGGAGSGGGDGGGRLSPLQQQMLLLSWALAQWLPAVARGPLAVSAGPVPACVGVLNAGVIPWVPPLVLANLDCKAAAAEAAASGAAGEAAEARAAAISWGRLLLRDMDLMCVVAEAVAHTLGDPVGTPPDCILPGSPLDALTHVAVAFPGVTRTTLLGTHVAELGCSLLDLLQRWDADSNSEAVRFLAQVMKAVGAGGSPPASAVAQLRSGAWRGADPGGVPGAASWVSSALRAAPLLLPPPCVAAALLRLPLCANPGCTNLEGDSEAGLRLSGCGRCKGAVSYCSRECQVAHWRAGHKEECCARDK